MINFFKGKYAFLSNFYYCTIWLGHTAFPTVEHAFQYHKNDDESFKNNILNTETPSEAKKIGRLIKLKPNWDNLKVPLMISLCKSKFSIPFLKEKLLNTDNEELIEGNYWHDNFWGYCYCEKCIKLPYKNMLGKILMNIRNEIKKEKIYISL